MNKKIQLPIMLHVMAGFLFLNTAHAELPERLALVYRASWGVLTIGKLERSLLKISANSYVVTTEVEAAGLARLVLRDVYSEKSLFRVDGINVFPQSYRLAPVGKPEKERIATFDWKEKVVNLNNDRSYPLKTGIQDAATFLFFWMLNPPVDKKRVKYLL